MSDPAIANGLLFSARVSDLVARSITEAEEVFVPDCTSDANVGIGCPSNTLLPLS